MILHPIADDHAAQHWDRPWTVAERVIFTGVGVHTGDKVRLEILPADAGTGLRFRRMDLPAQPVVPALAEHVSDTRLSTTLTYEDASVQTVEHLVAALWGLGVTDAWLELYGAEVPIMDGSAEPFVKALDATGVRVLVGQRETRALEATALSQGDRVVSAAADEGCRVTVAVDYGHRHAGAQLFSSTLTPSVFAREIAPARTFGFRHEVAALRAAGLARGGSENNAIVIDDDGLSSPLRFPNEFARHKALDLIGDMALTGVHWTGHVVAIKAGHAMHTALAREIRVGSHRTREVNA